MKLKLLSFLILLVLFTSFTVNAQSLNRISTIKNTAVNSNQIAFSTKNIPFGYSVTVHCQLDNYADFYGYEIVTPYSGFFSKIKYKTCWTTGCGTANGPIVYLGLANTIINIYGVSRYNQAIVLTNYSSQDLYVSCWF